MHFPQIDCAGGPAASLQLCPAAGSKHSPALQQVLSASTLRSNYSHFSRVCPGLPQSHHRTIVGNSEPWYSPSATAALTFLFASRTSPILNVAADMWVYASQALPVDICIYPAQALTTTLSGSFLTRSTSESSNLRKAFHGHTHVLTTSPKLSEPI